MMYAFGAEFVEVRIHARTREIRVPRIVGAFAAGRIMNTRTARSQLMGGMIWGISSALHEKTEIDRRGLMPRDVAGRISWPFGDEHLTERAGGRSTAGGRSRRRNPGRDEGVHKRADENGMREEPEVKGVIRAYDRATAPANRRHSASSPGTPSRSHRSE